MTYRKEMYLDASTLRESADECERKARRLEELAAVMWKAANNYRRIAEGWDESD